MILLPSVWIIETWVSRRKAHHQVGIGSLRGEKLQLKSQKLHPKNEHATVLVARSPSRELGGRVVQVMGQRASFDRTLACHPVPAIVLFHSIREVQSLGVTKVRHDLTTKQQRSKNYVNTFGMID